MHSLAFEKWTPQVLAEELRAEEETGRGEGEGEGEGEFSFTYRSVRRNG